MKPLAVFVYGLPAAGKSTPLSLANKTQIETISFGDVVRKKATDKLADPTSENIGQWATTQREKHGNDIMARYTLQSLQEKSLTNDLILIEGARSVNEIKVFNDKYQTQTIRVNAPFRDRLTRIKTRSRNGEQTFTAKDLIKRDSRELQWGLGELFTTDTPNYTLTNTGSLSDHKEQTKIIIDNLLENTR